MKPRYRFKIGYYAITVYESERWYMTDFIWDNHLSVFLTHDTNQRLIHVHTEDEYKVINSPKRINAVLTMPPNHLYSTLRRLNEENTHYDEELLEFYLHR